MPPFYPQISPPLTSFPKWLLVSWDEGRRETCGGADEVAPAPVSHDQAQWLPGSHLTPVPLCLPPSPGGAASYPSSLGLKEWLSLLSDWMSFT